MSDDAPILRPIAGAFAALAEEQAAQEAAERARQAEQQQLDDAARQREADRKQLRGIRRKSGEHEAYRFGRAIGYGDDDIRDMLAPPAKPRPAPSPDAGGSGDGGYMGTAGSAPAAPEEPRGPEFKTKERPIKPLPADSPIVPLGKMNGRYFYLDPLGQFRELAGKDHNAMGLRDLAGTQIGFYWRTWPKYKEDGSNTGWKADEAAESLMTACSNKGVFNPSTKIRGVGGWLDAKGGLVLHGGDAVYVDGEWRPPGQYEGLLYPADDAIPRPVSGEEAAASRVMVEKLLSRIDTWNWLSDVGEGGKAIDIDGSGHRLPSLVLLGWIGAAMAAAALRFRPVVWVTGKAGSGKTSLFDVISCVLGGGLVKATNATEAGVSSVIGHSTKAVLLDESENDPDGRQIGKLIKLARESATGGSKLRGSSDHKAFEAMARSSFLFASIIIPPLQPADRSRLSILDLGPLEAGKAFTIDEAEWRLVGQHLRRRLIDGWPRWTETYERYRAALLKQGVQAQRGLDRFATLLGMADIMRFDGEPDSDTVSSLAAAFASEEFDDGNGAEPMLQHLLSIPLDVFRGGERQTIGSLVAIASGREKGSHGVDSCRDALKAWSIFVDGLDDPMFGGKATVTLPNTGEGLRRLFDGTVWRGEAGTSGGWAQAMKRLPGAAPTNSRRFGGRGWSVPARVFLLDDEEAQAKS